MKIDKNDLWLRTNKECSNCCKRGWINFKVISLRIIYLILNREWITDQKLIGRIKKIEHSPVRSSKEISQAILCGSENKNRSRNKPLEVIHGNLDSQLGQSGADNKYENESDRLQSRMIFQSQQVVTEGNSKNELQEFQSTGSFVHLFSDLPLELQQNVLQLHSDEDLRTLSRVNHFWFEKVYEYAFAEPFRKIIDFLLAEFKSDLDEETQELLKRMKGVFGKCEVFDIKAFAVFATQVIADILENFPAEKLDKLQKAFTSKNQRLPIFFNGIFHLVEIFKEIKQILSEEKKSASENFSTTPGFSTAMDNASKTIVKMALNFILEEEDNGNVTNFPYPPPGFRYKSLSEADIEAAMMIFRKLQRLNLKRQEHIPEHAAVCLFHGGKIADALDLCAVSFLGKTGLLPQEVVNIFARKGDVRSVLNIVRVVSEEKDYLNYTRELLSHCGLILKDLIKQEENRSFLPSVALEFAKFGWVKPSLDLINKLKSPDEKNKTLKMVVNELKRLNRYDEAKKFSKKINAKPKRKGLFNFLTFS